MQVLKTLFKLSIEQWSPEARERGVEGEQGKVDL
jgi:hypothetical protein